MRAILFPLSLSLFFAILATRKSARKNNRWSIRSKKIARLIRHDMNYAPTPRFFELLLRIFPQIIDYSVYFFSRKETALRINWIPPDLLYRIKKNRNLLKTIIYRTIHEIMWKIKLLKKVIINEFLRSTNIFRRFSLRHFSRLKKEKKKREREKEESAV